MLIFYCPCGPSREFYGCKPTCWGAWPAPGAEWRNAFCGPPALDYTQAPINQEILELPNPVEIKTNEKSTGINLDETKSESGPEIIPSKPTASNTTEPQKQERKNAGKIHQQNFVETYEKRKKTIQKNIPQENTILIRQVYQEDDNLQENKKSERLLNHNINPGGMLASFLQRQSSQETDNSKSRGKALEK